MGTSENAEELEVAMELQGKPKLIDPPASFRSAVGKYFGFPEVDGEIFVRTAIFGWFNKEKKLEEEIEDTIGKQQVTLKDRLQGLKKRSGIQTVKGYKPRDDVEQQIQTIASNMFGDSDDLLTISLEDRTQKYKFLTRCQKEFDHVVTNMDLSSMNTVKDVMTYFNTEVKDTCAYEDLTKLNLPKNLHINLEYSNVQLQSDPDDEKDEMFREPVTELKYRRKYKAHINKELEVLQH